MARTVLPFTNGFYKSSSLPVSAQECVNWYPVIAQKPALTAEYLLGTPGLVQIAVTSELKQSRGGWLMDNVPYLVNGDTLYRVEENPYSTTALGTISGTGRVSMADNGTQLMILVPGGDGYIYNKNTGILAQITDSDFIANGNPQYVAFVDGYFVCTTDSKKFIKSALSDGLSWNALDFGTAESDPDNTVAPVVYKNQLFIMGTQTAEAFQNVGGADFPFVRSGLFLSKGCYAPLSLINTQDTFMFIGGGVNESPAVWALSGNSIQKISTDAIDILLQELTAGELTEVFAWTYAQKGAYFVGFAIPGSTLVYEFTSQRWHERKSYVDELLGDYRVSVMLNAYGQIICADIYDGRVGVLDPDEYTEYDNPIIRRVVTQPFINNMQSFFVPSIELTVESGVGNDACENPTILMERSLDGKTWIAARAREIGRVGEYSRRAIWRRCGRAARMELFRFTLSDPVRPVFALLTADIVGGDK